MSFPFATEYFKQNGVPTVISSTFDSFPITMVPRSIYISPLVFGIKQCFSPPARWGLLDFMSVAWSSSSSSPLLLLSLSSSSRCPPRPPAQLRLAIHSVLCRTSTTTIHAQCSLPDLNHDHPRPVFPAGPQPRPSTPSVPCRTSTASIPAQCSLPDLNHDHPRPVFPAGPQPRVSTPKDMPHRVPEDMPDRMLEDMPDRMPEGMPDRMPDRMSARMPEDMPDKVPECLPDRMPADLPDNMPEDMLDRMPDGMPEDLPDNMPEDMPDRMPDGMPEDMPEHMPEDMPEHLPEDMPEHLPEDMPGRMPEDMPDRMPDRMPENMSDRMPEDLPVTKCINVMVGITRSKVIFISTMETFISTNGHLSWKNLKNNVVFSLWSHHELSFSENALDFLCWLPWGTWGKPWLMAPTEPASLVLVLFFFRAGLAVTSWEGKAKNIKQRLFGDPDIPKAGGIPKVVKIGNDEHVSYVEYI